jgi:hypothetical protein
VFGWAVKDVRNGIIIVLGLAVAYFAYGKHHEAGRAKIALQAAADEVAAHEQTVANYVEAQAAFEQAQIENVERVETERAAIVERVQNAKRNSDAEWSGRFERLRNKAASRPSGASHPRLPAPVEIAGQPATPDPSPGEPIRAGLVAVRVDDLETLVQNSIDGRAIQMLVMENEGVETD